MALSSNLSSASGSSDTSDDRFDLASDRRTQSLWRTHPLMPTMADKLELVIGIYEKEDISKQVLKSLEQRQRERVLVLLSTAILVRTHSGQLLTRQIVDWNLTEGGMIDGLTAALVSLLNPTGCLGAIAFNSGGLSVEVLLDHLSDIGLTPRDIESVAQAIEPGSSILITLTKSSHANRLMAEMAHAEAKMIRKTLSPSLRSNLGDYLVSLAQAVVLEQSEQASRFNY